MKEKIHRVPVKLDVIIKEAAQTLEVDEEFLRKLVYHQFQFVKNWLREPTSIMLQLYKFGFWKIKRQTFYRNMINNIIPNVRRDPSPARIENLRYLLKYRHILNKYYSTKRYSRKGLDGKPRYSKVTIGKNVIDNGVSESSKLANV